MNKNKGKKLYKINKTFSHITKDQKKKCLVGKKEDETEIL